MVQSALAKAESIALGRESLEEAAAAVDRYLASGGNVFIEIETEPDLYRVFEDLAGEEHGEAQAMLEALGAAGDLACNRWTPVVNAAYYVGLAMGLKLAGGKQ